MTRWNTLAAALALSFTIGASQAETPEVAKGLLDSAIAEVKTHGIDKAAKDINAGGKWNKGSLYVVMANFDGVMIVHSSNDKMLGKNLLQVKDAGGKPFVQEAIALAKAGTGGQFDMRWANPTTKQIADATMIVRRVPGQDMYAAAIVFK